MTTKIRKPVVHVYSVKQVLAAFQTDLKHGIQIISTIGDANYPIALPIRSDHFYLSMVSAGEMTIKVNLINYTVKKNCLILLSPQVVREILSISPDFATCTVIFTMEFLTSTGVNKKMTESFEFLSATASPSMSVNDKEFSYLAKTLEVISTLIKDDEGLFHIKDILLQIFGAFFLTLSSIYTRNAQASKNNGPRQEELTFRFIKLLEQHYKSHRSVSFYADVLNVTPNYLSHVIKEVTARSAHTFIREMVMLEARILLTTGDLSIGQIAEYLNFSDQFSFSKFFKKQSQLTPSEFRKAK